jgi:hypothetical protein
VCSGKRNTQKNPAKKKEFDYEENHGQGVLFGKESNKKIK